MSHIRPHRRRRVRIASWIALVAAIAACVWAIVDFSYRGFAASDCFEPNASGPGEPRSAIDSDLCRETIMWRDLHQRRDAAIALFGVAVMVGSIATISKASRRTRNRVRPFSMG